MPGTPLLCSCCVAVAGLAAAAAANHRGLSGAVLGEVRGAAAASAAASGTVASCEMDGALEPDATLATGAFGADDCVCKDEYVQHNATTGVT